MSLREQAAAAADKVELKLAFAFYAPPRYALGGADPRNLFDKTGLHPLLANFPGFGQGVDVTSTLLSIERGAVEANPFMRPLVEKPGLFAALKIGVGIATGLYADSLARKGHPGWAKAVAILGGAVPLAAGGSNLRNL